MKLFHAFAARPRRARATRSSIRLVMFLTAGAVLAGCSDNDFEQPNFVGRLLVDGDAIVGSTLTADPFDADGLPANINISWSADGTLIDGASGLTYTLTTAEVGALITATANYVDLGGSEETVTSEEIGPVTLINSDGAVTVAGTPTVGETLTATVADADGATGAIAYQWQADGADIAGATAQTLVLSDDQFGAAITVNATYTDDQGFDEDVTSDPTAAVAGVNDGAAVTITGTPTAGEVLTATVDDPDGASGMIAYQWLADGAAIAGATAQMYTLTAAEVGSEVTVQATYTDDQNFDEMVTSAPVGPVAPMPINVAGMVAISGTLEVGGMLMATITDGNGLTGAMPTYQWSSAGATIAGATMAMYSPTAGDVGNMLTVTVSYIDDDGFPEMLTSAPTAAVPAVATNVDGVVTIIGTPRVGDTLTAQLVDANGVTMSMPTYQWFADGMAIGGATMATYTPVVADVGAVLTVTADYTDDQGFDEMVTSAATAAVDPAATNTAGSVAITGTAQVAETLTATVTDTNGTTGSTIAYQWAADSTDISGATGMTYVLTVAELGAVITVTADYTDDDGFDETVTSAPTAAVVSNVTNTPGAVSVIGTTLVGETLTANVTDTNGTTTIGYQWKSDGSDIGGATAQTFVLTAAELGTVVSVTASYTDDDGFDEMVDGEAADVVYSAIVTGETTLLAAAGAASDGDVIGLDDPTGGDDYADMAEVVFAANNLQVRRVAGSTAVITGATCLVFSGDAMIIDGLVFDDLDWIGSTDCDSNGDGSVYVSGDGTILRNSEFLGEAEPRTVPGGDAYHYITVKGNGNIFERNLFEDKDMDNEGSIISIFADPDPGNQGHIIRYNLFRNIIGKSGSSGNRDSTAHALQIGRSTGMDSTGDGNNTVQFNRFENVESERRIMRVQSGNNTIEGNTFVNTLGLIALEDGYGSTVRENVILSNGDDNDDGGISFAPLGHTIVDNYLNNLRTTSGQRGGLLINPDPLSGSGNTAIIGGGGLDFTVTVARNTVVNARQAILFDDADCADLDALLDFDDNFVMNQSSSLSINANTNGVGRAAVTDDDWDASGCDIDAASDFDNNHFYSDRLAEGAFNFNGAAADNTVGGEDGATFVQDPTTGLVDGSGPDAGVGVDTSILNVIEDSQVGPGSTWVAP